MCRRPGPGCLVSPRALAPPGRYSGRSDAGCLYELTVKLLSEHEDVLAEFSSGQVAVPQDSDDGGWIEVSSEALGRRGGARARWAGLVETLPQGRGRAPRGEVEGPRAKKSRRSGGGSVRQGGVAWVGLGVPSLTLPLTPQISHTFTDYGPGVRFVRFEHGGQDSVYWKGWFGARVTNSSVWVEP